MTEDPEPGAVIAGYRLVRIIGSGGMGTVFEAVEVAGLGRRVAVKVLAQEFADDPRYRARFLAEARAAGALDHPHIVPVYAAGEAGDVLFLAMRLIDGPDLGLVLKGRGPLAPARAAAIIRQVAEALDAAHAAGIVHGDVKPANILLGQPGGHDQCYVTDFGVARRIDVAVSETPADGPQGTYAYMAPEVIEGRHNIDGRADGYSLACVAYEALAGEGPFRRESPAVTLLAQIRDEAPGIAGPLHRTGGLDRVLARQLSKDPAERYPTCLAFADGLGAELNRRPIRRRRWTIAGLAGAAIVTLAAGAFLATEQGGSGASRRVSGGAFVHFRSPYNLPGEPARAAVASLVTADVNGDGRQDVIVTRVAYRSPSPSEASIFINHGAKFRDETSTYVPGGLQAVDPRAVLVQDLTGDGHADILVGDHGATRRGGHLTLLVWERGQFVPRPDLLPRSARELAPTTDLATADVNGDGLLDVFVDNGPGHASELLLSRHNSAGGLERFVSGASWLRGYPPSRTDAPARPIALFVDVNSDFLPDLVLLAGARAKSTLELTHASSQGAFTHQAFPDKPQASGAHGAATAVAQADLNGDGYPDLVIGWTRPRGGGYLQVLSGNRYGAFVDITRKVLPLGTAAQEGRVRAITPIDFNADGRIDLAVTLDEQKTVFYGNQGGRLTRSHRPAIPMGVGVPVNARDGERDYFVVRKHDAGYPEVSAVLSDPYVASGPLAPPTATILEGPYGSKLVWAPVWGAAGYDVYAGSSSGPNSPQTTPHYVTGTSFKLPSTSSVTYYTVRAVDAVVGEPSLPQRLANLTASG